MVQLLRTGEDLGRRKVETEGSSKSAPEKGRAKLRWGWGGGSACGQGVRVREPPARQGRTRLSGFGYF